MNILTSKTIDKGNAPKDITIIRKMFDSLGIEEYEKNTLNYMSEFINSYIIDILKESKKNMILSNREKINIEDVELAVKKKQFLMYQNRCSVSKMKDLAEKVNSIPLPQIPDIPNVLMPPMENNLLRNNFQIYSEELNRALLEEENKNILESTSLRPDDINILGNKRKANNLGNDSKNNLNSDNKLDNKLGGFQKKKRKISLNQAFKKSSQENAKKENMININENNNNIKINLNENKQASNLNSLNNEDNDDDIDFDNDENEMEKKNNPNSTNNFKDEDEDDLKMEDDDNGDDDMEGEEIEENNESNNEGNESFTEKEDEKVNDKKNNEDEDDEDDY